MGLFELRDLRIGFDGPSGRVRAVDGMSFRIDAGQTLGIVGESGCGKSVTGLSIMRLLASPPAVYESGVALLDGRDLFALPEREMRKVRGGSIAMIFQEPMTSLNPVYTVGAQIAEAIRLHRDVSRRDALDQAEELLARVGIPSPETNVDAYPHQLSGGMRQRVMIAMALSCSPQLLIADEPTTALDVTIQAQILDLIARFSRESGMGVVLITHDLSVVAEYTQEVVVMYAGQVVEHAKTRDLFAAPRHPYTRGLLGSLPRTGTADGEAPARRTRLPTIAGMVPDLAQLGAGCRFADRCAWAKDACKAEAPPLAEVADAHLVRCIRAEELATSVPPPRTSFAPPPPGLGAS
jgi:oligopeptide/dipeptide ABC transporter ATP-binding protein